MVTIDDAKRTVASIARKVNPYSIEPFIITKTALKEVYLKGSPFIKAIEREGKLLYMKNALKEWMEQSREELEAGKYLLQGKFFKVVVTMRNNPWKR